MSKDNLVKIIPKSKPEESSSIFYLIWGSILILIIIIGAYLFLDFQIKAKNEELQEIKEKLVLSVATLEKKETLEKVSEKVDMFADLFENHRYSSEIISFLKDICHPNVQFTSLQFNLEDNPYFINISAKTKNFNTLIEQILAIRNIDKVSDVKVSNVSLGKDAKVSFKISLVLPESLVLKNKNYE